MSGKCALTGKGPGFGNDVFHSQRKTRRIRNSNIQRRRVWVEEKNRWVCTNLSTRAIETLVKDARRKGTEKVSRGQRFEAQGHHVTGNG